LAAPRQAASWMTDDVAAVADLARDFFTRYV
jgi:hypothetical protein